MRKSSTSKSKAKNKTIKKYDVIIVGAGPAGIFTALELVKNNSKLKILLIDKGKQLQKRHCAVVAKGKECTFCAPCDLLYGWGGAGTFSDGKLVLSTSIGGLLEKFVEKKALEELIKYTDAVYLKFGAKDIIYGADDELNLSIAQKASLAGLVYIPSILRHLGTENCFQIVKNIEAYLNKRIDILMNAGVFQLLLEDSTVIGVELDDKSKYYSKFVVVAPGRQGTIWLTEEAKRLNLRTIVNPVDVGVRVEVLAKVAEPMTQGVYESKFIFYSKHFDDKVRTFCMCPYGEVVSEYSDGIVTVNGHSYAHKNTKNTNFALLVSKNFTQPFKDPIAYGQYIARLGNILAGKVMVQRLGDLLAGRRSTAERLKRSIVEPTLKDATPGDLSLVLPYRHLTDILEMLQALNYVAPGMYSPHTLLYGVEIKSYSSQIVVNKTLETQIHNLFAAGDGAGITRGVMQASVSGVMVAREILKRAKS